MRVKIFALLLVLFTFTSIAISQNKPKEEKSSPDSEKVSLPDSPNSWIINIHQRGGFVGVHKLLLAINSDGKYACGENAKIKMTPANDSDFLELAELIKPIENDIFFKIINESLELCNDCLFSTFSFRRQKEKAKDGEIAEASAKQAISPTAKEVSEKLWKTVKCD